MDDEVLKMRRGGGARGTVGPKLPASAPAKTRAKPLSPAWHAGKRAAMSNQATAARAKLAAGSGARMPGVKHGGFKCANCGHHDWREHPVVGKEGQHHATLAFQGCVRCGTMHASHVGVGKDHDDQVDVAKEIDSSETALQTQGGGGAAVVGHRRGCPKGGDGPCGKAVGGKCSLCSAPVQDHFALTHKTIADVAADLRKMAGL